MKRSWNQRRGPDRTKTQECRDKLLASSNKRFTAQIRKILGKHYANKYRVR